MGTRSNAASNPDCIVALDLCVPDCVGHVRHNWCYAFGLLPCRPKKTQNAAKTYTRKSPARPLTKGEPHGQKKADIRLCHLSQRL